ncbi:hypothetical protein MHLP_03155 [Candidatus Mycoplasma haematolamae str. Purdue]|uniref:YneF family protein n=1 Tax=Mycoplasma haematolamae (strain Purdue) TaxID=1212765 RepID=I7CG49_MYCHA|nr:YneF family protein [Candidatus Mycoplasma haematolamae]AFO52211.1 hypothetical protein MHLP_03155 [Candidatus Mycoplasma haematolamae str. Purdue]
MIPFRGIFLVFQDASTHTGWAVGLCLALILGLVLGWRAAAKRFSKQLSRTNLITASQIRQLYKAMGRTPTEKQIKQLLADINNRNGQ